MAALKEREESDMKNVQTDLNLLRENIRVLEARWALLSTIVTNLPARLAAQPTPPPLAKPAAPPTK